MTAQSLVNVIYLPQSFPCSVASAELSHDHNTDMCDDDISIQTSRKTELLVEVLDLAHQLLRGVVYAPIAASGQPLPYSDDDILDRLCNHNCYKKAMLGLALNKPDADLAVKDLILRCATQVAAEAMGLDLDELMV